MKTRPLLLKTLLAGVALSLTPPLLSQSLKTNIDLLYYVTGDGVVLTWSESAEAEQYLITSYIWPSLIEINRFTIDSPNLEYVTEPAKAGFYSFAIKACNQFGCSENVFIHNRQPQGVGSLLYRAVPPVTGGTIE